MDTNTRNSFLIARHTDPSNLKEHLTKYFYELQTKRNDSHTLKIELTDAARCKHDMERDIKNYAQELADLRIQLKIALAAVNRKQHSDDLFVNNVRLNVNFEALSNENEQLNQQLHWSNKELIELTRENADFREQIRILRLNQCNFTENYEKLWKAMSSLNEDLQRLESDQKTVQNIHESSRSLASKAQKGISFYRNVVDTERQESNKLKEKLFSAEAKLADRLEKRDSNISSSFLEVKQLQEKISQLEAELKNEKAEKEQLSENFDAMTLIQDRLNAELQKSMARNKKY